MKHLLYAYRVLLTGIHAMRTGEIVANVLVLNDAFRLSQVGELCARKRSGAEAMRLSPDEVTRHVADLERLEAQLHEAHAASALPDEPTTADALDALVVRLRLHAATDASSGSAP